MSYNNIFRSTYQESMGRWGEPASVFSNAPIAHGARRIALVVPWWLCLDLQIRFLYIRLNAKRTLIISALFSGFACNRLGMAWRGRDFFCNFLFHNF